jgi:hypothetical protein
MIPLLFSIWAWWKVCSVPPLSAAKPLEKMLVICPFSKSISLLAASVVAFERTVTVVSSPVPSTATSATTVTILSVAKWLRLCSRLCRKLRAVGAGSAATAGGDAVTLMPIPEPHRSNYRMVERTGYLVNAVNRIFRPDEALCRVLHEPDCQAGDGLGRMTLDHKEDLQQAAGFSRVQTYRRRRLATMDTHKGKQPRRSPWRTQCKTCLVSLILAGLTASLASAAESLVQTGDPPPLIPGVAAMPQIVGPADKAQQRINRALRLLDHNVLQAVRSCGDGNWQRTVTVPMGGPAFLAVKVTDNVSCSNAAHPTAATWSIVYNLSTGQPVDWTRYLPATLTGRTALATQLDGTKVVTLASSKLLDLYLSNYRSGATDNEAKECRRVLRDAEKEGVASVMVWPDAVGGGLAAEVSLPHAMAACMEPVIIPLATLRDEGTAISLLHALAKAGARKRP